MARKRQKNQKKNLDYTYDSETSEEWVASDTTDEEVSSIGSIQDIEENKTEQDIENKTEQDNFKESDYVVVKFPGHKREHIYVCIIQELLPNNEAEVVGLKQCSDEKSFVSNEKDVSVIHFNQIIERLNFPKMIIAGDRLKYQFDKDLKVDG
ncbi:hypothetical protein JTB14_011908 [Gonioctena quinquepunctata]|nr:hypothetical protein JTB14_011908 [Gonioctena quinquepunctata]